MVAPSMAPRMEQFGLLPMTSVEVMPRASVQNFQAVQDTLAASFIAGSSSNLVMGGRPNA